MNIPLVSIIIPTFNRVHLICETLDSLLAQTYTNWECIVVDDGSTDGTDELLRTYCGRDSRFKYHHRPTNRPKGANTCRNYGFELSKGKYVNWFDDDDVMLEDFLKMKVSAFTPKLDLVICSGYYVDEVLNNKVKMIMETDRKFDLFKDYLFWKLQIITNSILFRKSFLIGKELFLYRIKRGQETELFSRLFFKLPVERYKIVNNPLFLYRQHPETKTAKNRIYINNYKESHSFIAIENLKKAIEINDLELISYNYRALIEFFFRGIENKHTDNSKNILNNLVSILIKRNRRLTMELFFFGKLFIVFNRGMYRIEKRLKSYKV